ncbi:hypothetical protein JNJ66_01000 [Candidatus Saccharibacteria bacterium]|nr:hypothetical protein [Candidatus Saccharibacteria bacterium]
MSESYARVLAKFIEINEDRPVILFAVLKMDELVDKWSILISADWITGENNKEVFRSLIKILQDELEPSERDDIARVVIYDKNQHFIKLMLRQFKAGQHILEDAKVNGNIIHEGYIIALNHPE